MPKRFVVCDTDDFYITVQPVNDVAHIHILVYRWAPSVLKTLYSVFNEMKVALKNKGYVYMATISPNPKFAKLFGGEVIEEKVIDDVYHEAIVWGLIQSH